MPSDGKPTNGHSAATTHVSFAKDQLVGKELKTEWGWGRPSVPAQSSEFFASRSYPWMLVYTVDVLLSLFVSYIFFSWNVLIFLISLVGFCFVFAFPAIAFVMVPYTWLSSPDGPSNLDDIWELKDPKFKAKYAGHRVPIEELYEAYFDGLIDIKGNKDLLDTLYKREGYARFVIGWGHAKFFLTKFIPELLTHSRSQDVEQVREHYDRGDDFYAAFLGTTMIYTSGIFQKESDTLEEAQHNKLELVAQKIHLKEGESHLDIGCGWGTCITHFAKNYGTDSTGVTLGLNQTEWANNVAAKAGVKDKARALCMDYRDIPAATNNKKFDKITCLEMSEHVGVKYYSRFVDQVYNMLEDDGMFYLQIAGLRRPWQLEDFNWGLFMGKYIFPGADASCPLAWVLDKLEGGGFEVHSVETVGIHYSATIKRWYDNWQTNEAVITEKYGQRWFRLWSWFLAWSVISPEQGSATCYQIVCHKNTRHFNRKIYVAERANWKI